MLSAVGSGMGSQKSVDPTGMPADGVELVISQNHEGGAIEHHVTDEMEGLADLRAAVNNISKKDSLAGGVAVGVVLFGIAELGEEFFKDGGVAVDVADDVVGLQLKGI